MLVESTVHSSQKHFPPRQLFFFTYGFLVSINRAERVDG